MKHIFVIVGFFLIVLGASQCQHPDNEVLSREDVLEIIQEVSYASIDDLFQQERDSGSVRAMALRLKPVFAFPHDTKDSIILHGFKVLSQTETRESMVTSQGLVDFLRDSISGGSAISMAYNASELIITNDIGSDSINITGFADSTITADTLAAHLTRFLSNETLITQNSDTSGVHRIEITSLNNYRQYAVSTRSDIYSNTYDANSLITVKSSGARYLVSASPLAGYTTDSIGVIPTGSNYAILQSEQGYHNVTNFGAVADDVNEDTEYFRKAIKFASLTGTDIKSQGTYIIDSIHVPTGVEINNTGGVLQQLEDSTINYAMIEPEGVVTITGGEIRGNRQYFTDNSVTGNYLLKYLVNIDGATSADIENVRFVGSTATALRMINSYNVTVRNCIFDSIGYSTTTVINGIYMGGQYLEGAKVLGCTFNHINWDHDISGVSDADAIQILGANGDTYKEIRYIDIIDNTFKGVDNRCIKMQDGFQVHIANNVADSANMFFSAAMADTVSNVNLIGNDVYNVTEAFSAGAGNAELAIDFNIFNNTMNNVYRALNSSDSSFYVNLNYRGNVVHNSEYTIRTKGRRIYIVGNYFGTNGDQTYPFVFAAHTSVSKGMTAGDYVLKDNDFYTASTLNNVINFGGSVKKHVEGNDFYYPTTNASGFFNASTTSGDSTAVKANYASFVEIPTYIGSAAESFTDKMSVLELDDHLRINTSTQTSGYAISTSGTEGLHVSGSGSTVINRILNTSSSGYAAYRASNSGNQNIQLISFGSGNSQATNGANNQGISANNDLLLIGGTTGSNNVIRLRPGGWSESDQLRVYEDRVEVIDSILINGMMIYSGNDAPGSGIGTQGSLYMRNDNDSTLYTKTGTGWALLN